MKNIKIRARLILGFSIVVMLTSIGGISGIIGVTSMDAASSRMYNHETKPMIHAFSALDDIERIRIHARDLVLHTGNAEKIRAVETNMYNTLTHFETVLGEYGATVLSQSEERKIFDDITAQYTSKFKPDVLAVLEAAKTGASQETLLSMTGGFTAAADTITADINRCIALREQSAEDYSIANSKSAKSTIIIISAVSAASVFAALMIAFALSNMISKPLLRISAFLQKVQTTGDMTFSEEDQKTLPEDMKLKDEIGVCVNACAGLVYRITDVNEKLTKLSKGDLTSHMELLSEKDSIGLAFNNMIENLNAMFLEIQGASDQIASGAQQISQGAQELASGSSEQAVNIEKFSASLAEVDRKIHINEKKAINAQKTSDEAGAMLEISIRSMGEMLGAMKEIDESSKNITKVIKVIDDIAFQTNILALNAAVEAARAGQHGKGFAVVADEVRNLAAKSAEAARETAELIEGSSEKVREGNEIVEKTNASLEAVVTGAKEASVLLGEVAADSTDQARAIQEVNHGIEQISSVVQENSSSAEQSAAASQEMAAQAVMLNDIVTRFKLISSNSPREKKRPRSSGFSLGGERKEKPSDEKY